MNAAALKGSRVNRGDDLRVAGGEPGEVRAEDIHVVGSPVEVVPDLRRDLAAAGVEGDQVLAAELLASGAGIAEHLGVPVVTDRALDAVAHHFDASPLLIQRQHENQLA